MIDKILLDGLDCAGCAVKIEQKVERLSGIKSANLNFVSKTLTIEIDEGFDYEDIKRSITDIVKSLEPHVNVVYEGEKSDIEKRKDESRISGKQKKDFKEEIEKSSQRFNTLKIVAGAIVLLAVNVAKLSNQYETMLYLAAYILVGYKVLTRAARDITSGRLFDESFLMSIATVGALILGEFNEAVAVMLFFQVGEEFQSHAVNNSRKSIKELLNIKPKYANVKMGGQLKSIKPESVKIGEVVIVKPGEKIPLDGKVVSGSSMVDTSTLTGESIPKRVSVGAHVLSGCINKDGAIEVQVEREFEDSAVSKILELVENASAKKAPTEQFITKFSRYYTPFVVSSAAAIAIGPYALGMGSLAEWVRRSLIFLVVSCPCALVVSVPLGFFGGIGSASRNGILIKGGNYLEALNEVETMVFDKTGTLTKGNFEVAETVPFSKTSKKELIKAAALAEAHSNHPIGDSIKRAYGKKIEVDEVKTHRDFAGKGVSADVEGETIFAGNEKLMAENGIMCAKVHKEGTVVHVARGSKYMGYILIEDQLKENAKGSMDDIRSLGVKRLFMLTGDKKDTAEYVSNEINLDGAIAQLLPHEKVSAFEKLQEDMKKVSSPKKKIVFVGDGINDAPALARADIGISMGALGSDAAIEAADIVIMDDKLSKIPMAIKIAGYTKKIVIQNIVLALGVKGIVLVLGALGMASMWMAVFADVGVALIAILNSTRVLAKKYA